MHQLEMRLRQINVTNSTSALGNSTDCEECAADSSAPSSAAPPQNCFGFRCVGPEVTRIVKSFAEYDKIMEHHNKGDPDGLGELKKFPELAEDSSQLERAELIRSAVEKAVAIAQQREKVVSSRVRATKCLAQSEVNDALGMLGRVQDAHIIWVENGHVVPAPPARCSEASESLTDFASEGDSFAAAVRNALSRGGSESTKPSVASRVSPGSAQPRPSSDLSLYSSESGTTFPPGHVRMRVHFSDPVSALSGVSTK